MQPTEIGLGTSAADSSVLKLNYEYGTTANNGNVLKQVITVPTIGTATGFTATQNYQYDQLNRLTGAQEVNGTSSGWQSSATLWQQMFSYDRYGNRAVDTANSTSTMIGPNPQISTSTNRITPRTSPAEHYEYDAAGNLKKGQSGDTFTFDAENKLVQYEGGATQSGGADYSYDGDGKRVKKAKPSETTTFIYNISGQLVAEYTTSTPENNGTNYLTSDTLGSPRVLTKADGSIKARHDYLPFGEEVFAGTGNRTTGQMFDGSESTTDKTRQKFAGKERDIETQLDFSEARFYASTQGRFTSSDPLLSSGTVGHPQSWNRYSYVLNNPLQFTDPLGLYVFDEGVTEEQRKQFNAGLQESRENLKKIEATYGKTSKEYAKAERALNVYGAVGVKNGVTIFVKDGVGSGRTGVDGAVGRKTSDNPTGQNIRVEFDPKAFKTSTFGNLIGHEGSHAADGSNWVKSGFANNANPTTYQLEVDGYTVQSLLAQAKIPNGSSAIWQPFVEIPGKNPYLPGQVKIWDSGWAEADRAKLRSVNIDRILARPKEGGGDYELTPTSKDKAFKKGATFR